ncbi:MAG: hypothetical protein WDM96_16330 [Lacunisphaera sp.]
MEANVTTVAVIDPLPASPLDERKPRARRGPARFLARPAGEKPHQPRTGPQRTAPHRAHVRRENHVAQDLESAQMRETAAAREVAAGRGRGQPGRGRTGQWRAGLGTSRGTASRRSLRR